MPSRKRIRQAEPLPQFRASSPIRALPRCRARARAGLAASIAVNSAVDPSQGGTLTLLRDGGIGGGRQSGLHVQHSRGGKLFRIMSPPCWPSSTRRKASMRPRAAPPRALWRLMRARRSAGSRRSRQGATNQASSRGAVVTQTTSSLSSATGVNLDEQMSRMLDLEHSYQASAELITTVKTMLDSLLSAIQLRPLAMVYISSLALSSASRASVMQAQSSLAKVQQELSSGKMADIGLGLGSGSAQFVSLEPAAKPPADPSPTAMPRLRRG